MKTSNSAIQTFKSCRRLYELKYIHNLEPVETADALKTGISYHEGVEWLLKEWLDYHVGTPSIQIEDPKVKAMVMAFNFYIIPKLTAMGVKPVDTEEWFSYETESGHVIVGRVDGKMTGNIVIEHKTTSSPVDGAYFQKLEFDEQIPTYMLAFNADTILYTVCQKPTIRQKKNESDEDFFKRCCDWYDEDTESKINVIELKKSWDELETFKVEQDAIVTEMENCKLFYRNPSNCSKWGRMCEYASVCMNYDPEKEYIQFKRRENHYEEAGKAEVREIGCEQTDAPSVPDEAHH